MTQSGHRFRVTRKSCLFPAHQEAVRTRQVRCGETPLSATCGDGKGGDFLTAGLAQLSRVLINMFYVESNVGSLDDLLTLSSAIPLPKRRRMCGGAMLVEHL